MLWRTHAHPAQVNGAAHGAAPWPIRVCPDHGPPRDPLAGNARVAFWVAPNMEFFEYLPESRPTQPDIPHYARMDYGNRVGFWRMLEVLNTHQVRACCCLNLELLDHFPEITDAMIAANWDYMAHGLYNSRPIYHYTERAGAGVLAGLHHAPARLTGKRLKGRLGGGAAIRSERTM